MAVTQQHNQPPPLLRLPPELHLQIITHLVFPETTHLRATSRHFASLIPPQPSTWLDLLAAENGLWSRRRNRLACVYCARLLPAHHFTDQSKSRSARHGGSRRACATCQGHMSAAPGYGKPLVANAHAARRTAARAVEVDWVERGFCVGCQTAFGRWGRGPASVERVCAGCWVREGRDSAMAAEAARAERDVRRWCGKRGDGWGDLEVYTENFAYVKEREWPDWWFPVYCHCCDYPERDEVPRWREGWRGVQVRRRVEG